MNQAAEQPRAISVREAAKAVGIAPASYYAALRQKKVPGLRIGGRCVVPRVQLDAFLAGTWGQQ